MSSKKGKSKRGGPPPVADSTTMSFHQVITGTLTAGAVAIAGNPTGIGGRILVEADAWAHFRWRSLHFRLCRIGTVTSAQIAGWTGGIQDTAVGTLAQAAEILPSVVLQGTATVPTKWVKVRRDDLNGPFPWYKAIPGSADPTEEAPGNFFVTGTGTDGYYIEFKGVVQFKVGVAAGNTPEELALRKRLREIRIERERAFARENITRVFSNLRNKPLDARSLHAIPAAALSPASAPTASSVRDCGKTGCLLFGCQCNGGLGGSETAPP